MSDLKKCIDNFGISNFWTVHDNCNKVSLFHVELDPQPYIQYSVSINENLELTVAHEKNPIMKLMNHSFPTKICNFNDVITILNFIEKKKKTKSKRK